MPCRNTTSRGAKAAKVDAVTPTQASASEAKLNGSAATPAPSRKGAIKAETASGAHHACKVLTSFSVELMCLQHIKTSMHLLPYTAMSFYVKGCPCNALQSSTSILLSCWYGLCLHAMPCSLVLPFSQAAG